MVAALPFLLQKTPLPFRLALFVGLFFIAFAILNHLIGLLLAWRKGRSSPAPASTDSDEVEELRTKLGEAEQERDSRDTLIQSKRTYQVPSPVFSPKSWTPEAYPFLRPEELGTAVIGSSFTKRSIYISDLARGGAEIINVFFDDCYIFGPAILCPFPPFEHWPFDERCEWDTGTPIFWTLSPDQNQRGGATRGAVMVSRCHFRSCSFVGIGILRIGQEGLVSP